MTEPMQNPYLSDVPLVAENAASAAQCVANYHRTHGWQPIETAPRGVEVLLFEPASDRYKSLGLSHKRSDHGGGIFTGITDEHGFWSYSFMGDKDERDTYFGDSVNPTHWMPLPEPPTP
jgi:hypothetical protein